MVGQTKWPGDWGRDGLRRDIQYSAATTTTIRASHPFTPLFGHDGSKESTFFLSFFITSPIEVPFFFSYKCPID
jgi:hypothetical protein